LQNEFPTTYCPFTVCHISNSFPFDTQHFLLSAEFPQKMIPWHDEMEVKQTNLKASNFMSNVIALIAKHDKLSLGIIYSLCFSFQFKLLSVWGSRNLVISTSSVVLLTCPIFKLTEVLMVIQNFKTFVLSNLNVSCLALNYFFKIAKT
jgi:hypothetical protein